jgi:hypothetical protein
VTSGDVATGSRGRRGLRFKLAIGVCAVVLVVPGWLLLERTRGQAALRKYEKVLIAEGERLTLGELLAREIDAGGRDAAIQLVGASSRLQTGACLTANAPPAIRSIAPGKALVITKEAEWVSGNSQRFRWEDVAQDLRANRDVLDEIRAQVRTPHVRHPINYRGFNTLLPHIAPMRAVAKWFSASALHKLRLGNVNGAIDDIETTLLLAKMFEDEPIIISQVVRIAVVAIAIENCWAVLQQDEVSDAQLARLQGLLDRIDFPPGMASALEMERVMGRDAVHKMRAGDLDFRAVAGPTGWFPFDDDLAAPLKKVPFGDEMQEAIRAILIYPMWRHAFSYGDEKQLLQELQKFIDATRSGHKEQSAKELRAVGESERTAREVKSWRQLATSLFLQPLESCAMRSFRGQTHCEIARTAIALQRYHLKHRRYPAQLADLVPEFLSAVPIDFIDGEPLRYRIDGYGFALWSVGNNAKDDGGVSAERGFPWSGPIGKDAVWPQAASEAELAAYREAASQRLRQAPAARAARNQNLTSEKLPD